MNKILDEYKNEIDEKEVEKLEKKLNILFSNYYRKFLCKNNGGQPEKRDYLFKNAHGFEDSSDVFFFSVLNDDYKDSLIQENNDYKKRIPENFIAIGNDSGGNLILMEILTEEIYFWDHELENEEADMSNCYFLANNFKEFFEEKLYEYVLEDDDED